MTNTRMSLTDEELELIRKRREAVVAKPRDWRKVDKLCKKCGLTKKVLPDFGVVETRGKEHPQGWCSECRAHTNYHTRKRKYRTKNNP